MVSKMKNVDRNTRKADDMKKDLYLRNICRVDDIHFGDVNKK